MMIEDRMSLMAVCKESSTRRVKLNVDEQRKYSMPLFV